MKILIVLLLTVSLSVTEDVTPQYQTSLPFQKATNAFTPCLYKETLKKNEGNFLVSPFSAETALAFAQSGCKDDTALEIRTALHLPEDNQKTESSIQALLPLLTSDSYTLRTVNKIYVKEGYVIKDAFKKTAANIYRAELENIDFTKKIEAAEKINTWVEGQTEKKIQNLISSDVLTNKTRAILVNALYFKAKWAIGFPPMHTAKADFYKSAKQVVQVDMMYLNDEYFNYFECPHLDAKLVKLPFKGEAVMTVILPNDKEGLAGLENKTDWAFMPHNFTKELVNIALPKFKIETKLNLRKILKNLGVVKAFDDQQADLSGIAGDKGDLILSKIVQKTFIDVGELGVEAAAATYIPMIVPESGIMDTPKVFIADHPFIFYIKIQGVILFAGQVLAPN